MFKLVAAIIALSKSIETLDKWIQQLTLEYYKRKVVENDKDFLASMDMARVGDARGVASNIGKLLDE